MDTMKKITAFGLFDDSGGSGKGKAVKKAVTTERENAARAAQKSAERTTPSLMTPMQSQSRTNSINGMGKVGKY
jgi:hypothetical protein